MGCQPWGPGLWSTARGLQWPGDGSQRIIQHPHTCGRRTEQWWNGWRDSWTRQHAPLCRTAKLLRKETMLDSLKNVTLEHAEEIMMFMAQKMSPAKRSEITEAINCLGEVERDKSPSGCPSSPSPSLEGESSP